MVMIIVGNIDDDYDEFVEDRAWYNYVIVFE